MLQSVADRLVSFESKIQKFMLKQFPGKQQKQAALKYPIIKFSLDIFNKTWDN